MSQQWNQSLTPDSFKTLIDWFQSIAVGIHSSPDWDCIGAWLGVGYFLEDCGKDVQYFSPTPPSEYLLGIDWAEKFQTTWFFPNQYDLIIVVDTANQERSIFTDHTIGSIQTPLVIIDHHADNSFQKQDLLAKHVDATSSSCCEIIYKLIAGGSADSEDAITPRIATALLLWIITDTGRFQRWVNLPQSMEIASRLIQNKADYQSIMKTLYTSARFDEVQFWWTIVNRAQYSPQNNVIRTYILESELETHNIDSSSSKSMYSPLLRVDHPWVFVFFKVVDTGDDRAIKMSFRTRYPEFNVSLIAHEFGWGWHPAASWAKVTFETDRQAQLQRIIKTVETLVIQQTEHPEKENV